MTFSHRFNRPETLDRALYWLTRLGIKAPHMEIDHQAHLISFRVGLGQSAAIDALINALELSEGEGRAADWDAACTREIERFEASTDHSRSAHAPIGWHADADRSPIEPGLDALFEAIRRSESGDVATSPTP